MSAVPSASFRRAPTVIGVLSFAKAPRLHLPPLRLRALAAEALMQGARLALFSAQDCSPDDGTVLAETWSPQGWIPECLPLPAVVFIVTSPLREHHRRIDRWVRDSAVCIRDRSPDKLALPALLAGTPLARYVIPQAAIGPEDPAGRIAAWMRARGDCVVKAVDGKRGHGIHRLHAGRDGLWRLHKDESVTAYPDAAGAASAVARRIAGRLRYRAYIVQTYVTSTSPDGRAADIRVHVQRDGLGRWGVTRSYVRLGEAGHAVSNVSRGGYQGPFEGFLSTRRVRPAADLAAEIEAMALQIAGVIETAGGGPLSELGIDIAIDPGDRLWLIEANAQPQSRLHEHDRAIRTIAYALRLASGMPSSARNDSIRSTKVPATTDD